MRFLASVILVLLASPAISADLCNIPKAVPDGFKRCPQTIACPPNLCGYMNTDDNALKSRVYSGVCQQQGCMGYAPGTVPACLTVILVPSEVTCPQMY